MAELQLAASDRRAPSAAALWTPTRNAWPAYWGNFRVIGIRANIGGVARFFDLSSIAPGADFRLVIERSLHDAAAVSALIGPHWLDQCDERGQRRLDDPDDVIAAEVAQALARALFGPLEKPK